MNAKSVSLLLLLCCIVGTTFGFLPIPSGRGGPPLPAKGYNIESFGGGLYVVSDWAYQFPVVLTSKNRFVLSDPPQTFLIRDPTTGAVVENRIVTALREIHPTALVSDVIYSHSHADHCGAMQALLQTDVVVSKQKVRIWASEQIARRLKEREDPTRPLPTDVVVSKYTLKVDDRTIVLTVVPYHEPGAFKISFPASRAAYFCDLVFQGWAPFKQFGYSYDLQTYAVAVDDYLSGDIDLMICGHFTRTSVIDEARLHRQYVASLLTTALKYYQQQGAALGAAVQQSDYFNPSSSIYQNVYALIFPAFETLEKNCAEELINQWGGIMAGVDVVAESHCLSAIEALRVDITEAFVTRYAAGENMYDEVVNNLVSSVVKARYHDDSSGEGKKGSKKKSSNKSSNRPRSTRKSRAEPSRGSDSAATAFYQSSAMIRSILIAVASTFIASFIIRSS